MTTVSATTHSTDLSRALYDPVVVFVVGALMTLGVVMVFSASVNVTSEPLDWHRWWDSPLRQGLFALAGFLGMLITAHMDYHALAWRPRRAWPPVLLLVLSVALLVAMLIPGVGRVALGARRSIPLPGVDISFQPTELAKVVLVVWLAAALTRANTSAPQRRRRFPLLPPKSLDPPIASGDIRRFSSGFLPVVVGGAALIGLTAIEDFGTAALMGVVMIVLLLVGEARLWHVLITLLAAVPAAIAFVLTEPYRVGRVLTFFSDKADPAGAGYQVRQALLAIGSGGWWGRGLGAGVQKYGYLPQDNNDFILAVICEELGIVGGLVVVAMFLVLLLRGAWIAAHAPDRFGRLLAVGFTLLICLQAAFNVAVVTDSVPTKGISLPFVSAGGSGVVFLGLAAGVLASIGRPAAPPPAPVGHG